MSYPLTLFPPAQILEHMIVQIASMSSTTLKFDTVDSAGTLATSGSASAISVISPRWSQSYGTISSPSTKTSGKERQVVYHPHHVDEFEEPSTTTRCVNRCVLVLITTLAASHVPCFGLVSDGNSLSMIEMPIDLGARRLSMVIAGKLF